MRPFADVVRQIDGGACYDTLSAALAEIVQAVGETGKVGELTFKLKIKPNGPNSVSIFDEVKIKVPEPARGATIFFVTEAHELVREDPRQAKLPLREVDTPARELKEVARAGE